MIKHKMASFPLVTICLLFAEKLIVNAHSRFGTRPTMIFKNKTHASNTLVGLFTGINVINFSVAQEIIFFIRD